MANFAKQTHDVYYSMRTANIYIHTSLLILCLVLNALRICIAHHHHRVVKREDYEVN